MSRPLYRGVSGLRISRNSLDKMKDKEDKGGLVRARSSDQALFSLNLPMRLFFSKGTSENGFASDPSSMASSRSRHYMALLLLKISLVLIVVLAVGGSLLWTISITTSSRRYILSGYKRLQEQLSLDMRDIGELSLGPSRLKEVEFCSQELENFIPCFNISTNAASASDATSELHRNCEGELRQDCLIRPPINYKVPLRWPTGKDLIWVTNVKITAQEVLSSGSLTKRLMMLDEEQISFRSASLMFDGIEDYSHQIAEMIGLRNESNFIQVGIRTILDVGCGYGSFGAHLFSKNLMTMCIANYESSGSQVQVNLERGLPAVVASFNSAQLPFPSLSFDIVHCARCGVDWDQKDGAFLIEADRVLRPGGYFVWTSPLTNPQGTFRSRDNQQKWNFIRDFAQGLCWEMLSQQEETVIWRKTMNTICYASRKPSSGTPVCDKGNDMESPHYRPLQPCIGGTHSRRWIPVRERMVWPSRARLNSTELQLYGIHGDDFAENMMKWSGAVRNYWSLLSPLIFSDHPKRPGDEDPSPPYNMLRNVMDMNAHYGSFNLALLDAGKSVWVMNVVPISGPNFLPLILDRGLVGVLHDWCEAFPTYPRTYDMVHADGLLSLISTEQRRCSMLDVLMEVDRLLRPEGWVILRDATLLVESARPLTTRLKWEARVVELESDSEERLLVCQKPFVKRVSNGV